jgi:hypothetical protein
MTAVDVLICDLDLMEWNVTWLLISAAWAKLDGRGDFTEQGRWCNRSERWRLRPIGSTSPELRSKFAGAFLLGLFSSKWCGDKGNPHPRFNVMKNSFTMVGSSDTAWPRLVDGDVSLQWQLVRHERKCIDAAVRGFDWLGFRLVFYKTEDHWGSLL